MSDSRDIFTLWQERILLLLFGLMPLAVSPWSFEQFNLPRELLLLLCAWLMVLLGIAAILSSRRLSTANWTAGLLLLFAAWVLFSWCISPWPALGFRKAVGIALTLAAAWVLAGRISARLVQRCLWLTVAGSWINGFFGMLQFFGLDPLFVQSGAGGATYGRHFVGGFFGNPNLLGIFLAQAMISAGILLVWNWHRRNRRWLALASMGFFAGVSLLCQAVAALMGLGAAALVALPFALKRGQIPRRAVARWAAIAGGAAILFVAAVFALDWHARERVFGSVRGLLVGDLETATHGRFHTSRLAWQMAADRPLFGNGPGTYAYLYFDYRLGTYGGNVQGIVNPDQYSEYVHNEYLQTAAELGWPFSILSLGLALGLCRRGFRSLAGNRLEWVSSLEAPSEAQQLFLLRAWALLILVCTLVNALANFPLHTAHSVVMPLLSVALLLPAHPEVRRPPGAVKPARVNAWLLYFVLPLGLAGAFWLARPYRAACIEQTAFRRLAQLQAAGISGRRIPDDRLIADLESAVSLDPGNAHLLQMLGATHLFRSEPDKALAALSRSIKLRKDSEVLLNYGLALAALGRKEEARESFQQGLLFLPDHPQLQAALAWLDRQP